MRWTPYPDSLIMFIVMPAIWGIGDAIWQSQINGKKGTYNGAPDDSLPNFPCLSNPYVASEDISVSYAHIK